MKKEKLGNIFRFLPKSKIKAAEGKEGGKYPFFKSGKDQSKRIDYAVFSGESLIFGDGGDANIVYYNGDFSASDHCYVVQANDKSEVYTKYVYYYLKSHIYILQAGFKGAGLKNISKKYLSNIKIPFPETLEEQIKISNLLTQVDTLIDKREESIGLLDELLKSTFLDIIIYNKQKSAWPLVTIKELAEDKKGSMRTGPFGSNLLHDEFTEEGDVAVLGIDNAVKNKFTWGKKRYISYKKYEELKRYTVFPEDIIITIMGTVGRSAVVPDDIPLSINTKHLAAITLNKKISNPYFISYSIHSDPFILNQIRNKTRGAIMAGFNLTLIKSLKMYLPPKLLQDKFATIVLQVEDTKKQYQKSLDDLNQLFGSISQRAFKGELDLNNIDLSEPDESEIQDDVNRKITITVTNEQLDNLDNISRRASDVIKTNELKSLIKQAEAFNKLPAIGHALKQASMTGQSFRPLNNNIFNIELPRFHNNIISFDFNSIISFNTFEKFQQRIKHIYQMLEDIPQIKEAMENGVLSIDDFLELPLRYDYEYSQIKRIIMNKLSSDELKQYFDESSKKIKLVKSE